MPFSEDIKVISNAIDMRQKIITLMMESLGTIATGAGSAIDAKTEARECLNECQKIMMNIPQ